MKTKPETKFLNVLALSLAIVFTIAGCGKEEQLNTESLDNLTPPELQKDLIDQGITKSEEITDALTLISETGSQLKALTATNVHFGVAQACVWNPNICNNSFVTWPGYIQNTAYGEWAYAWMSNGPGTSFISFGTGDHYHIMGLFDPVTEPNPKHSSMFGSDWFAFYMQRSGQGRINFDLNSIRVKGTVPIRLHFKNAGGQWFYWSSLPPGNWNLSNWCKNIKEFHVRASSGSSPDQYSLDDIVVRGI